MANKINLQKRTAFFIRDLHARESMRLGWYRQLGMGETALRQLRERKAHHIAFLHDLLRKRSLRPAWYARIFYLIGHGLGLLSRFLPQPLRQRLERTLESWILLRYRSYHQEMTLDANLRSMIESLQLARLEHNEPAPDVLQLIRNYIHEQEHFLRNRHLSPPIPLRVNMQGRQMAK